MKKAFTYGALASVFSANISNAEIPNFESNINHFDFRQSNIAHKTTSINLTIEEEGEVANYNILADTEAEYNKTIYEILNSYSDHAKSIKVTVSVIADIDLKTANSKIVNLKLSESVICNGNSIVENGIKITKHLIEKSKR